MTEYRAKVKMVVEFEMYVTGVVNTNYRECHEEAENRAIDDAWDSFPAEWRSIEVRDAECIECEKLGEVRDE